ncbi:MAG: NAD-binding protein [Candidatus Hermodarchaeota archaeon]
MLKKKITKLKILVKQNLLAFTLLTLWFIIHLLIFYVSSGYNISAALLYTFYFDQMDSYYGRFYPTISSFLIFGWLLSLITKEVYRKYHPEQTSLALSRSTRGHTIIIGYSNLGQRIQEYLRKKRRPYVVIEANRTLIEGLIDDEEPVLPRKAHDAEVLEDASIRRAKLVLSTKNDLETLVVATNLIRDVNKDCKIVCRCFDDSLAQILEKQLDCGTISTSRYASALIFDEIDKARIKDVVLIGCTNTTRRLMQRLKSSNINYQVIEKNREAVEDIIDEEPIIIGDAKDEDILEEAGVRNTEFVAILIDTSSEVLLIADQIRELNENCRLMCRFFHEEVAEILEKPPFNAYVLSTSKNTLEKLIENGVFNDL